MSQFNIILLISLLCLINLTYNLHPKNHKKTYYTSSNSYYSSSSSREKSPYEKEKDALKSALYCNDNKMQTGDSCYCGRVMISCCKSKEKCTGTLTRSCSEKVDDYKCDNQVSQGLAYWQELQNLKKLIECSNEHYDKTQPCTCGVLIESCCKNKDHCDVGTFSENCDSKLEDSKCESAKLANTNLTKPKYYTEYFSLFSSFSEKLMMREIALLCIFIFFFIF